MQNLQELPKLEDSISYIYIEHAIIERHDSAIIAIQDAGKNSNPDCSHDLSAAWSRHKDYTRRDTCAM